MSRFGRIIDIDLSTGKIEQEDMSERKIRQNLGGFGYNVETLYRRIKPGIDPFDPDNLLVISRGLFTGSVAPSSSRIHINALSPLSELIGPSICISGLTVCKSTMPGNSGALTTVTRKNVSKKTWVQIMSIC